MQVRTHRHAIARLPCKNGRGQRGAGPHLWASWAAAICMNCYHSALHHTIGLRLASLYSSVQQVFGHSKRGASARWQRRAPHQFPHRRDRTSQHSSSIKSINNALKIIRIGDSESPRRALSNCIALTRLYGKVKSPAPHFQRNTWYPPSFAPMGCSHPSSPVSRAGSDSRAIIIPTLDSEALGDRCRELCDLFVLFNGDLVPLM